MGKKKTKEDFVKCAKKVHGSKYNYDLVNYINSQSKIKIVCLKHGVFEQEANSHLQGKGCPFCAILKVSGKKRKTKKDFIIDSKKVHGNKYNYKLVDYINNKEKVKIICPKHGIFEQRPDCHVIKKQGCPKCGGTGKITLDEFINRSNDKHDNFYDYNLVDFKNIRNKVKIICPKHGIFEQTVKAHLQGQDCPKCKISKLEKKIVRILIKDFNVDNIIQSYKTTWLGKQHIDIFLPLFNVGIECQGIQHYEPIERFGGNKGFQKTIERDILKKKLCKENNLNLIEIPYYYSLSEIKNKLTENLWP